MTAAAMGRPYFRIIGHPTGRTDDFPPRPGHCNPGGSAEQRPSALRVEGSTAGRRPRTCRSHPAKIVQQSPRLKPGGFPMRRLLYLLLAFSLAPGRAAAEPAEPPQWLVVTAPAFRAALEPLCRHRQAQGMRVVVLQTSDVLSDQEVRAGDAAKLAEHVRQRCRSARGTSYVLLVGAVEVGNLADAE